MEMNRRTEFGFKTNLLDAQISVQLLLIESNDWKGEKQNVSRDLCFITHELQE